MMKIVSSLKSLLNNWNRLLVQPDSDSLIVGLWSVEFVGDKEKAIYKISRAKNKLLGYCKIYIDSNGNRYACDENVLTDINLNGSNGKATYNIAYNGKNFSRSCNLKMDVENMVELSYSVMGDTKKEIWRRMA